MARVSGKCPVCGEIIRVNDEKAIGHCGKCGAEINVSESIRLFQTSPTTATTPLQPQATTSQRRVKREQREHEAEIKAQADNAKQYIRDIFQQCSNEQDYLALRPKIMGMNVSDAEKARLLEALDVATKERLVDTIKQAKDYEESQESPVSMLIGFVVIIAIGFVINHFFSVTWPGIVAVVLSVIGLIGNINDRLNKKKIAEGKAAAELITEYRKLGYKI